MKGFVLSIGMVLMFTIGAKHAAHAQQNTAVITISCLGHTGMCAQWHHAGSDVWHTVPGIRIYENPYPWGMGRTCPTGSTSAESIFIFDSGSSPSSPAGVGYVNAEVCADDEMGEYSFVQGLPGEQIYTDYEAWKNAAEGEGLK